MKITKSNLSYQLPATSYQSGVTLLIAIVMLGSMTFISLALSTILLREMAASRLILITEIAFAGANAGGEVSLYKVQRYLGNSQTTDFPLGQSGATFDTVSDLTDNPYNFTVGSNQTLTVNFYDADNPNTLDPGYRSLTIANNSGSQPIKVDVIPWAAPDTTQCAYPSIAGNQSRTCNLTGPDYRYQAVIKRQGAGSASGSLRASSGVNGTGSQLGIPSANPLLDVIGKRGEVRRRIQIHLSQ